MLLTNTVTTNTYNEIAKFEWNYDWLTLAM